MIRVKPMMTSPERVTLKMNVRTVKEPHPDPVPKVMEFVVSVRIIQNVI